MGKVIGKFAKREVPNAPAQFDQFVIKQTGYNERLGIIPASIAPSRLNSIRNNAAQGGINELYELYNKCMATDSRIGGIVGSLLSTVGGLPVKVIRARGASAQEEALADDYKGVIEEALGNIDLHSMVQELAKTYLLGARVIQWQYQIERYPQNKMIALPTGVRPIADGSLLMEMQQGHPKYGEIKIITQDKPNGIYVSDLDPKRIMVVQDGFSEGQYDNKGAMRRVLGWWVTKVYAQLWWVEYTETFGQPTRVARYGQESTSSQKAEMKRFMEMMGRNRWGLFPEGMDLQLMEANQQGSILTYDSIIGMANNEIAVALVGQTGITQDSAQGSRAKLQVLNGVRIEIVKNIATIISKGMKHFVEQVLSVNYGDAFVKRLAPTVTPFVARPEAISDKVDYFEKLQKSGFPVPVCEISEETGISEPEVGEKVWINGQFITWTGEAPASIKEDNGGSKSTSENEVERSVQSPSENESSESGSERDS